MTLPPGFVSTAVFTNLENPTAVEFSPDGRVFVAEKSGLIKVFDSVDDPTPAVFADLRTNVHNYWDRGLTGVALDPGFPGRPFVYVAYTYDHMLGDADPAPRWGTPGATSDSCPTPPGPATDGCVVSGRVSRLTADGNVATGAELVLVEGWCQQFPSHSVNALEFGPDGALYASAGDGASFFGTDYGQLGGSLVGTPTPRNPCGDPPEGVGGVMTPPDAQGGALRAQGPRSSRPTLSGSIIRISPSTGEPLPDNPALSPDESVRRIVAYGLRNPFRMAFRPGTGELWTADVGWLNWEELNRLEDPLAAVGNFGWPCYEGSDPEPAYATTGLALCSSLYATANAVEAPYYAYHHDAYVAGDDACSRGSSSISGLAFYPSAGGSFPAAYGATLFFADYSRDCIWAMPADAGGEPDPAATFVFGANAPNPVDLQVGPDGNLWFVDFDGGAIWRIRHVAATEPPVPVIDASPSSGAPPLAVQFDGSASYSPSGAPIAYSWDLDGDGVFGDSTSSAPTRVYSTEAYVNVGLRVTANGQTAETTSLVVVRAPPAATIDAPTSSVTWKVGDVIPFAGHATDADGAPIPASHLSWDLLLRHCPSNCHTHVIESFPGVAAGSVTAPAHEYPSQLELRLTAQDADGRTATSVAVLEPQTSTLTLESVPPGMPLTGGTAAGPSPLAVTAIVGSTVPLSAPITSVASGATYRFVSWSDGGAAAHDVVVGTSSATYVASYYAPTANAAVVPNPQRVSVSLQLSGTSPSGIPLAFSILTPPTLGSLGAVGATSCSGSPSVCTASVTYTPSGNPGLDSFTYRSSDGQASSAPATVSVDLGGLARQWGADRYATAAGISSATFEPGVPVAYVASGRNFPDALAGAAAAGFRGGPVLLVDPLIGTLPGPTAAELARLAPDSIVVLGGAGAVPDAILNQLDPYTTGPVTRQWGADRYATAASISAATFASGVPVAYIASGANFPDALAGAAVAGFRGGPVLLVNPRIGALPASTATELARLAPGSIVVLGGPGAVPDVFLSLLDPYTSGSVTRQWGADRYATAAAISAATFAAGVPVAYIASGTNFPDALAGAAAAGFRGGPVLLVNPGIGALPGPTAAELTRLAPKSIVVLGGSGAVPDAIYNLLGAYVAP